ncbi:MAG: hypothetical protein K2N44_05290 [Lachnospiraceae bacterium]|nr:hypothetical protein [Lachnospiraceae bacterium]
MAKLQMKSGFTHKLKIPLILTLAQLLILSTFTDIRIPLTHLEDRFEGIDVGFFLSSASKSAAVNSFNAGRALERIGQSDFEKMYQVMALSAIKQAGIPTERLHADTATISFYGEYDTEKLDLTDEEKAELLQIEKNTFLQTQH